jgi:hypothetical protein
VAESIDRGFDPGAGDAWKHCPALDRHGFGEISCNPPWLLGTMSEPDWPTLLRD